jgi:hypothetical protein
LSIFPICTRDTDWSDPLMGEGRTPSRFPFLELFLPIFKPAGDTLSRERLLS